MRPSVYEFGISTVIFWDLMNFVKEGIWVIIMLLFLEIFKD